MSGRYRAVATLAQLPHATPRHQGELIYVQAEDQWYAAIVNGSASWVPFPGSGGSGGGTLESLSNVADAPPGATGEVLTWTGTQWDGALPTSAASLGLTYVQGAASATWVIPHSLPFQPNVAIVDSAGDEVEGTVVYSTPTQITVSFSAPFAGVAYLS